MKLLKYVIDFSIEWKILLSKKFTCLQIEKLWLYIMDYSYVYWLVINFIIFSILFFICCLPEKSNLKNNLNNSSTDSTTDIVQCTICIYFKYIFMAINRIKWSKL